MNKKYCCSISGEEIPQARVEYLMESGIPQHEWTTVSNSLVRKKKGVFMGEVGTSELRVCDKLYSDSVRSVFHSAEVEADPDEAEAPKPKTVATVEE